MDALSLKKNAALKSVQKPVKDWYSQMRWAFAREQNAFATVHVILRQICATARVWILEKAAVDIVAPMVIVFARSKILWMQFSGHQLL